MSRPQRSRSLKRGVKPRIKVWLETGADGEYVFGSGICRILRAVAKTGSIKQAAEAVGKSYRHVWSRIKEAEQALGAPLVETQVGGRDARRSELTDLARQMIDDFDALKAEMQQAVGREFDRRFSARS